MKRVCLVFCFVLLAAILSSCGRHVPLEDLTIPLLLGVDLDDENNLIFSVSSPVFNKDAKKNIESYQIEAKSIRDSRKYFDALATGEVTAAKIQLLLIGRKVLEHEDWFPILDTIYRNPRFSLNTRVITVDGPVADVIFYEPEDKAQLPLHLKEVIDKSNDRMRTVQTTLQRLHRLMYEKGMTPSIAEIKKGKDVKLVGTALLDEKGKYTDSLSLEESSLLLILQDEPKQELTLTIPLTSLAGEEGIFYKNVLSIDLSQIKSKVKTKYEKDTFHFDYKIDMTATIEERLFPLGKIKEEELKEMIEQELKTRFEDLIKKIQENKIDPIGLGIHARAFQYEQYKKVEENWADALAEADINVSLKIEIRSMGATK